MDKVEKELSNLLSNLSFDELNDVIGRMEKMKITRKADNDVMGLISAMNTLTVIPNNKKLDIVIDGVKGVRNKIFSHKWKTLQGRRKQKITEMQIDDMFATMDALKSQNGAGPWSVHSKWPRYKINQMMAKFDLKNVNKRDARSVKALKGGKKIIKKKSTKGDKKPAKKVVKKKSKCSKKGGKSHSMKK